MEEEKLQGFHQSLLANPNIKGIPTDYSQFATVFEDPVKGDSFFKSLKSNPNIKGLPDTYDVFVSGLIQKTGGIEVPKTSGQFTPGQVSEFGNKSFLGKIGTGFKKSGIGMLGGIENMIAEYLPVVTVPGTALGNVIDPYQSYVTSEKLKEKALKNFQDRSEIYGKGGWFTLGTFGPLLAGTAASALLAPVTSGTSLAAIPTIISGATLAGMTADVIGNSLLEQDIYAKEHGREADPFEKNAVAWLSGAAMLGAGKIVGGSSKLITQQMGKAVSSVMKDSPELAVNLMRKYIAKNPQALTNVLKQGSMMTGKETVKSAAAMGLMTGVQDYLANIYKDPDDKQNFEAVVKDIYQSAKGGALLGAFLGPMGAFQMNKFNSMRRSSQGINIVQTKDGKVYERVGDDPKTSDKVVVLDEKLNTTKINRKDIVDGFSMNPEQKDWYLDAWKNHKETIPEVEDYIKKNAIYRQSMKIANDLAFQGPGTLTGGEGIGGLKEAGKFVRMIQDPGGESFFVTREMPGGETELAQLFPRGDGTYGVKKFTVKNLDYSKVTDMPVQDYANMAVDYYTNIKPSTPEGKAEGFTSPEEAAAPENAEATINNYGQNIKFNSNVPLSEDHNPMVVVASHKMDGRKFFVTGESGQNGDHIFTGFDADALREAGFDFTKVSPELIKASDIQDRMNIPYAQWLQNEVNLYQQTRQQSDQIIAQANAPVQEGQEVTLKDKNFVVTQTGQDGVILNEINEKGELTGESITVTPDKYGEVFGTPAPEGQQQAEQTLPADQGIQPEANQAENALVSTGAPAINEGIQQTPTVQPGLKTAKLGKTNITYQEQPDGSFLIPANATDDVEKMAKQVRNEIDTDNFDVIPITEEIPIPDVAPFAKVKTQKVATGIRIMPKAQTPAETITPAVAPPVSEIKPMSQEAPASVETAQVQTKLKEEPQNAKESRTGDQKVASESTSELEQGQGGGHNLRDNERKGIVEQQEQGKAQEVALEVKSIEKSPEEGVEYARRPDGTLKTKGEYTQEEWNKYTESVIDKKLSELPKQKEFWEMTKDDFINHITEKAKARGYELNDLVNKSNKKHKEFVSKAISERKPVPPEVLADYPELKQPDLPGEFTIESLNERAQRFGLSNRDMGTDILDYILNANEIGLKDDVAKIPKREWDQLRVDAFDIRINRPRRDASENREDKSSPSVDLTKANAEVDTKPTEAQVEAGNFKHGHLTVQGMEISIEKPAGSIRKGVDKTGKQWAVMLNNSYGYFRRTKGKDGDQIDVFLGDNLTSDSVYVIDQVDPKTGVFDEHKVMLGFNSAQDAKDNYLENYEPVWKGIGAISKMSVENFKQWLGDGTRTKKPVSKEIPVKPTEQKPEIKPEIVPAKTPEKPAEFAGEVLKKKPQPRNLYNFRKRDLVKNTITGKIYEIIEPAKGKSVNVRLKEKGGKQIENFNAKRVHWVPVQKEIKVKGKKRGPVTYKPDSDYGLALSKTPDNFEESVMQFFIGGGRVSTADFIRYMGFAPFGKEGYLWAVKGKADGTGEQGVPFDGMNEQIANSFGMEDQGAMAIENEIVRILKKYHTRSEMVAEILHRTDQNVSNEMSPEDIIDQMDDATPENVENIVPETVDNLLDKIVNSKEILSIFTSGRYTDDNGDIDWNKLKDLAENNHDYFTDFPFKLNETEFNNLKELLNDTARQREISQRVKSSNNAQGRGEENIIRAGTPAGQKGSGGNAEKPATRAEPAGEVKEYRYKMNARPFDIGTYPKEGFIKADNDPQGGFQILTYDRKLTAKERHHWSFLPLTEIDELRDKQFANKYGEFFVDLEWMGNNSGADVSMFDNKNQLVVKPFFMSTDEILKNIETGYWVEKQWEKPKETPKSDIDRINEILEKKPEEKPAKPNPPSQYSPIQQKQIDKINKDYSELIAKKQEAIVQAEKDIKDALLKADERNGLFGDVKPVEKDEIIKREEQGFTYNETTRAAVRKPFDEKIAELRKEIVELTLEQKGKIESVINQQDLFAMTPAEDNPAPIEPDNKESLPKLEDFGKKVGGARKDMGITRTVRDTDSLPAWRRKYSYANADGSIIIGQNVDTSVPFVVQWAKEIPTWTGKRTRYTLVTAVNSRDPKIFNSEEEAEAYIPIYEVWKQNFRVRKSGDNYVITKTSSTGKVIEYATFPTEEDANVYMYSTEGATSLLNHKREDFSIPALEKVERTGRDWRKGRDISTEEFMDTFGFRGGEFGNWVKPEERRVMLNAAYDSFMDLSEHLNIPPRTLSFGGELSIAFGARGTKGAAAHFEPDRAVINLTRMNGAGSLAHEWAHALDNYFGLQAAKKDYTRNEQGELKSPHVMRTSAGVFTQGMRKELSDLFDAIIDATQQKSVTRTMGMEEKQKAFDRVKERVQSEADSLLKKFENGVRRYQYNRKTKQREDVTIKGTPEQVKNVKVIIDKILTGEGERPKWSHIPESKGHLEFSYISPETLALDKLYKEVFGRTGLKQDGGGIYNLGYFADKMYPAKETFAKAVAGESETLKVPTDFLKTSKTFDASRANPYWSTKVEMFARAFEYFVETKLLDQNIRADYLQYDKAPVYEAVYGKNPYPAGEERTALNKLFQEFFGEIKVKTDENNVSLLYETNEEYIQGTLDGFDSEKQKQEAIDKAVKRAESQRLNPGRGAGSPLYPKIKPRTVLEGFKESGYIDFIGQKITSPQDVADLWSIHRSPNIEKAHAIFVKDGVIVGTTATTLNRNGMALFLDPSVILDLYNKFGADGVYYLHNHPSGNHKPSAADIIMTANHNKDLAPRGINIIGHIIIDTDKMSVIDVRERPVDLTNVTFSNDLDPYIENDVKVYEYKNSVPRLYSEREKVDGAHAQERMMEIAKALLTGNDYKGAIIYMSSDLSVAAYDVFPEGASEDDVINIAKEGLKNNLGRTVIFIQNGYHMLQMRELPAETLDLIDVKKGEPMWFHEGKAEPVKKEDLITLWDEQNDYGMYEKPVNPSEFAGEYLEQKARPVTENPNILEEPPAPYQFAGQYLNNLPPVPPKKSVLENAANAGEIEKNKRTWHETLHGVREYMQNMDLPLKDFEKEALKIGSKQDDNSKPARDMSLANYRRQKLFVDDFIKPKFKPVVEAINNIKKSGVPGEEALPYIIAKHAMERNPLFRQIELEKWNDKQKAKSEERRKQYEKDHPDATSINLTKFDIKDQEATQEKRIDFIYTIKDKDYSGVMPFDQDENGNSLNGYTNPDELAKDIVAEFEEKTSKELIDDLWKKMKPATSAQLDAWVAGGRMSRAEADDYHKRFNYFVPLRGWKQGAAKTLRFIKGEGFSKSLQHADGRKSLADNPLAYIQKVQYQAIGEQVDNEVRTAMYNLIKNNLGNNEIFDLATIKKLYYVQGIDPETGEIYWTPTTDRPSPEAFADGTAKTKIYSEHENLRPPMNARESEVIVYKPGGDMVMIFKNKYLDVAHSLNHQNYMYNSFSYWLNPTMFPEPYIDARKLNQSFATMGAVTNFMKRTFTQWNIVFPFTNFIRDIMHGTAIEYIKYGKEGLKVGKYYSTAFPAIFRRLTGKPDMKIEADRNLEKFHSLGAPTGWTYAKTIEQIESDVEKQLARLEKEGTMRGTARKVLPTIFKVISAWNTLFEEATRFSVYLNSLAMGMTERDAAFEAKEATVNFDTRGKSSRFWDSWFPFFKASMNALGQFYDVAKEHPKRTTQVAFAFMIEGFLSALMWALLEDKDDPESSERNRSPYMRQNYFTIPNLFNKLTGAKKGPYYLSIPLTQTFRGFYALGNLVFDVATKKTKPTDAMMQSLSDFSSSLVPVDVSGVWEPHRNKWAALSPIIPGPFRPEFDLFVNEDFTGNSIYRTPFTLQMEKELANAGLSKKNVSPVAKWITDNAYVLSGGDLDTYRKYVPNKEGESKKAWLDVNPSILEYLFKSYTGGTGQTFVDLIKTISQATSQEPGVSVDINNIPFVNKLLRKVPEAKWNIISEYQENKVKYVIESGNMAAYRKNAKENNDYSNLTKMENNPYVQEYIQIFRMYEKELNNARKTETFDLIEGNKEAIAAMKECNDQITALKKQYGKK